MIDKVVVSFQLPGKVSPLPLCGQKIDLGQCFTISCFPGLLVNPSRVEFFFLKKQPLWSNLFIADYSIYKKKKNANHYVSRPHKGRHHACGHTKTQAGTQMHGSKQIETESG